jgi:hypothetical protein
MEGYTVSDVKNPLEMYLVEKFKEIDPSAHKVAGSGSTDFQKSDISNKFAFVEAKVKRSHKNVTMDYLKDWQHTLDQMPINSKKFPMVAIQNSFGENFVILSADDFFNLLKDAKT